MNYIPKCFSCGRFCRPAFWKMQYSGAIPMPDEEIYHCKNCGEFSPDPRIRPEASCGAFDSAPRSKE